MLRGRYGIGWMIAAWAVIAACVVVAIWVAVTAGSSLLPA
jgi:hypothetical protein